MLHPALDVGFEIGINALTRGSMDAAGLDASSACAMFSEYTPASVAAIRSGSITSLT